MDAPKFNVEVVNGFMSDAVELWPMKAVSVTYEIQHVEVLMVPAWDASPLRELIRAMTPELKKTFPHLDWERKK